MGVLQERDMAIHLAALSPGLWGLGQALGAADFEQRPGVLRAVFWPVVCLKTCTELWRLRPLYILRVLLARRGAVRRAGM